MAITPLPTPAPNSTMAEGPFNEAADNLLGALPTFVTQANDLAEDVNGDASTAAAAASTATTKAGEAAAAASTATTKAGEASSSASTAATKASEASGSASDAQDYLVTFEESYIGQYASDAAANSSGKPISEGVFYFKTTAPKGLRIYKDSAWDDAVFEITGGFSGDYDDLTNKPTLGTAAAQNASAFATAEQGGKADTAVQLATDKATAANIRAGATDKVITADGLADALALTTPSGASNFAPDFNAFMAADWAVTGNRTLSNPTNVAPGETRYIFVRAASGTWAITFGSNYKGDLPTLDDVSSTKWYLLTLVAYSSTHIVVASVEALS